MFRAVWVGLALLAVMSLTTVVVAAPTAAEKQTARELVFSGRKKRRRGNVDGALKDLQAAHDIMNVPTTGYELGLTQESAGLLVEALDTLLSVGRMPLGKRENRAFKKARKDAKSLADEVMARVPTVKLSLLGDAAEGAEVSIDDKPVASSLVNTPIKLNPGSHTITATTSGGATATKTVSLSEGSTVDVTLELTASKADDSDPVEPKGATTMNPMVYVGFGVGAAGLIVGSITGGLALSQYADVAPQCPDRRCPPATHDDIDSGETLGTVSTVMFIVGGVGVAAGVVGLFLPLEAEGDSDDAWLRIGPTSISAGARF